jgi:hypothetical protein
MNDSQIVEYGKRKIEHFSDADSDSASGNSLKNSTTCTNL